MALQISTQHFINNEFVDSVDPKPTITTLNPATEEVLATVQKAGQADVDKAVQAARAAFKDKWETSTGVFRRDLLNKLADLIEKHADRLAEVESLDNGKPVAVAKAADIPLMVQHFRYFAGWADKGMCGKTIPTSIMDANHFAMTVHEPVGVVASIVPWNYPLLMATWKLAPLLACGCTTVLKSSEKTPLTALMLGAIIKEAGFPPGVVNIISGDGAAGEMLARHMDVDKVSFTGSSVVGHKIIKYAAESNMKRVSVELGGKSPLIICEDADLDQAAEVCDFGLFFNCGQCCCASSRILVEESIHDAFVAKLVEKAKAKKTGISPTDGKCDQGPVVDKIQFDKVMGYIESGKAQGAKVECGGVRAGEKGFFIEPTIFSGVTDDMKICKEEIFGPVMQCLKFKNIDDAVERANDSVYGLAAGICSRDIGKAIGIAKRLKAGSVWINTWNQFDDATPFGGYKTSGWGRDKSEYALHNFTEIKCIQFPINDPPSKKRKMA